jgi:hypothetical protein
MTQGAAFRGQPLLLLAGLLLGWLALRVALWQAPVDPDAAAFHEARPSAVPVFAAAAPAGTPAADTDAPAVVLYDQRRAGRLLPDSTVPATLEPVIFADPITEIEPAVAPRVFPAPAPPPRAVIGHSLLFMAGLSQMEVPAALLAYLQGALPPAPGVPAAAPMLAAVATRSVPGPSRWSADAWLLLRKDTTTPLLSGRPSYGRSQAGAVIRYRLASESALRPQAYLRVSSALAGAREREVAAGLSARPLAGVPLRFAAEARVGETDRGTRVRPAVFAVTEFPPLELPLGMRAEAYAQGGYVGGEFATAFVDGQARVERRLVGRGETALSAGAGVWGGAQKNAARLDVGPTAAVTFRLGDARGRLAADYRFRVAGDAEPSSGPALTLSAGF